MKGGATHEVAGVVEGAALVEAADSGIVQNTFQELGKAFGSHIDFTAAEQSELGEATHHVVDTAQAVL